MLNRLCRTVATAASLLSAALGLPACGGGSPAVPAAHVPRHFASLGPAHGLPAASCATTPCIYVTNEIADSVTVYRANASGNVSPIQTISGSNTGLHRPTGVAVDASSIYVSNHSTSVGIVTVYGKDANGNVSPTRTITGLNTSLIMSGGIAVGPTGKIYVTNQRFNFIGHDIGDSVTVYAPGATGNVAPVQIIKGANTGMNNPAGIALGAFGGIFVANASGNNVLVWGPGAQGNVAPVHTISGSQTQLSGPHGIALGAHGGIFVANVAGSVTAYAPGAFGNVAPIDTIAGSNTGLNSPQGIALGAHGGLFVANGGGNSVTVYSPGIFGNVAPIQTISGSSTGLNNPGGIALR